MGICWVLMGYLFYTYISNKIIIVYSYSVYLRHSFFIIILYILSFFTGVGVFKIYSDSKIHGANMGPIWGRQDPGGPHAGPMNFANWVQYCDKKIVFELFQGGWGVVHLVHPLQICPWYFALMARLVMVCCKDIGENWPNYNSTTLYLHTNADRGILVHQAAMELYSLKQILCIDHEWY